MIRLALALLVVLVTPAVAQTTGPVCGPTCTIEWNAVSTYTDGAPIVGPVTYAVYIGSALSPMPTTPTATVSAPSYAYSTGSGQRYVWITARANGQESVPSSPFAFVASTGIPAVPGNIRVR